MATNLLNVLANEFRGDVVNRIAGGIGESPAKTESALGGVLPALLGGLMTRASSTEGAAGLIDLLKRNDFDAARYANPASAITGPEDVSALSRFGAPLLEGLFGTRTNAVTDWLASSTGVSRSSSSSLMSLALPFVLSLIGRQLGSSGWSASGLMSLLSGQRGFLQQAAPAGLAGLLGLGGTAPDHTAERVTAEPTRRVHPDEPDRRAAGGWWKWAIPLLALLALIPLYRYLSSSGERVATTNVATTPTVRATPAATGTVAVTTASPAATVAPAVALGPLTVRKLPNGTEVNAPANGVESKLIAFIEDPARAADKETWFSFDRLEFETDSAKLRPSSDAQLRDIAAIMKAYPQVNLKIGGYTDNVGADAYNMKLSQDRANSTMNAIVKNGIEPGRLAAEGYGKQFPVADNATAEGRQRNRRIDVRVTKK